MENKSSIDKFNGYPHYPADEDITRAKNNNGKERFSPDGDTETETGTPVDVADISDIMPGTEADISNTELHFLTDAVEEVDTEDNRNLKNSALDNTDNDGEPLNEADEYLTGQDLDMPGSEADDANEAIGEEDEENNYYSEGDND